MLYSNTSVTAAMSFTTSFLDESWHSSRTCSNQ